jgi:ABC-type transport system substrate-binding protein
MPRLLRGLLLLFLILASIAYTPPLAQESEPTDFLRLQNLSGKRGGNIALAVSSGPSHFNRMMAAGLPSTTITDRLSADLVHINRASLQLEPSLATRWESDPSGRIYTIRRSSIPKSSALSPDRSK